MIVLSPLDILSIYWSGNSIIPNNPIRDMFIKNFTWDSILKGAQSFEIVPLLQYILEQIDYQQGKFITKTIRKQLKKIYYRYIYHIIVLHHELQRALNALQEAGIKVIVLKGAALAETVYKNIALRPMADIDLLIFKKDLGKAKEALLKIGFRKTEYHSLRDPSKEHPFHLRFVKEGRYPVIIELHWDIAKNPVNIEINEVMQRAIPAKIGGIDAYVMCPDDLLLYLCWHTAHHHFLRLIWLCDIAQVIKTYGENINWDIIIERAKRGKIKRAVYCSLYLAKSVLGAQVPQKVLSNLQVSNIETQIFQSVILNMEYEKGIMQIQNRLLTITLQLLIIDKAKDRVFFLINYIWKLTFPNISYIKVRYSISKPRLAKLYQFLHPFILIYEGLSWGLETVTKKKFGVRR